MPHTFLKNVNMALWCIFRPDSRFEVGEYPEYPFLLSVV